MSAAESDQYPARKLLIGGQWADSASREQIALINPANEEVFTHVASASEVDVDLAVKSARQAFDSMSWRRMRPLDRGKLLERVAQLIEENADELATLECIDNGKPKHLCLLYTSDAADE